MCGDCGAKEERTEQYGGLAARTHALARAVSALTSQRQTRITVTEFLMKSKESISEAARSLSQNGCNYGGLLSDIWNR